MKKLIIRTVFIAVTLFTVSLLFQIKNVEAQAPTDPEPVDEIVLGKWIVVYGGDAIPIYEICVPCSHGCDCVIGTIRRTNK